MDFRHQRLYDIIIILIMMINYYNLAQDTIWCHYLKQIKVLVFYYVCVCVWVDCVAACQTKAMTFNVGVEGPVSWRTNRFTRGSPTKFRKNVSSVWRAGLITRYCRQTNDGWTGGQKTGIRINPGDAGGHWWWNKTWKIYWYDTLACLRPPHLACHPVLVYHYHYYRYHGGKRRG